MAKLNIQVGVKETVGGFRVMLRLGDSVIEFPPPDATTLGAALIGNAAIAAQAQAAIDARRTQALLDATGRRVGAS